MADATCPTCGTRGTPLMRAGLKVQMRDANNHLWWIDAGASAAAIGGRSGRPVGNRIGGPMPNMVKKRP